MATTIGFFAAACPASSEPRHGVSAFGTLKYASGFPHFDYVDPTAPKGGKLSFDGSGGQLTFDSFNPFILKGDAAQGVAALVFDQLMVRAQDEPDAMYGLVARSADLARDRLSVVFELRPEARFSDGSPVTAEDAAFSFDTLKTKGHPVYGAQLRGVVRAEVLGPHKIRYVFQGAQVRDLPLVIGGLPLLSKAYYTRVNFEQTSLEPPLGSGPYTIGEFRQGSFVAFKRRSDYWAADLPVMKGRFNFDELRFEYFRDRTASLENFKAGVYDFREEFTARDWATAYDIPQVRDGRIERFTLPDDKPSGAQGFFINTRRAKFSDGRVRRALDYAFDYEWTNKNLFYGLYERTASYFENSDMKAGGAASAEEWALLEPFRHRLPAEFAAAEPYSPPMTDGTGSDRRRLREAVRMLGEAGWTIRTEVIEPGSCGWLCRVGRSVGLGRQRIEQVLRNGRGETLDIEFLSTEATTERILTPYVHNLRLMGVRASIRRVDAAQYQRRLKSFDFDIVTQRFVMPLTPGPELFTYFSSQSAMMEGSRNLAGIADPVVDAMIAKVMEAGSRAELVVATRALDRVLRAGNYWIPHWYKASHNLAVWSRFGRPVVKPRYDRGVIDTWWYDTSKAARLAGGTLLPSGTASAGTIGAGPAR